MRTSRLWALMLLPGGLALGHVLGYEAAAHVGEVPQVSGHGYLGQLSTMAVPVTLAVLLRAFVAGTRGQLAGVRFTGLAVQQAALYVVVELVEHAAVGTGPIDALQERSLVLGVLAQFLVAGAFSLLVHAFQRLGAVVGSAVRGIGKQHRSRRPWALVTSLDVRLLVDVACVSQRGPPVSSVRA